MKPGISVGSSYSPLTTARTDVGRRSDHRIHHADQPIYRDGPEKHLWERTWAAALPRVAATGLLTAEQGEALITAAERHTASRDVWVAAAKMFAVVGAKPA